MLTVIRQHTFSWLVNMVLTCCMVLHINRHHVFNFLVMLCCLWCNNVNSYWGVSLEIKMVLWLLVVSPRLMVISRGIWSISWSWHTLLLLVMPITFDSWMSQIIDIYMYILVYEERNWGNLIAVCAVRLRHTYFFNFYIIYIYLKKIKFYMFLR